MPQQASLQGCEALPSYIEPLASFYQCLLGYKPERTSLQELTKSEWSEFSRRRGLNPNSLGAYLPRSQTAVICERNPLALFHEYFGHGLFCEQTLAGRKLVDLERKLLEEERQKFSGREFKLEEIRTFRQKSQTFKELDEFRQQNLARYELFAVWTEYLLSEEFCLKQDFERRYESFPRESKESIDSVVNFSRARGNLATFYEFGLARRTNPERVKRLLQDIYGKRLEEVKFAALYGSKKEFSDIDVFVVSDKLPEIYSGWLDVNVVSTKDFESGAELFDVEVTHPLSVGEFILGDRAYFERFGRLLEQQPITEEAILFNLRNSQEQRTRALNHLPESRERRVGNSYSETYFANHLALKEGKRLFTREQLLLYPHGEKFIELKGGIE